MRRKPPKISLRGAVRDAAMKRAGVARKVESPSRNTFAAVKWKRRT